MEELRGYFGQLLRVALNGQTVRVEKIDPAVLRKYLGGTGYGARVLYDEIPRGVDPLSAGNKLMFVTSPLTANRIPGGGSVMLCFKSPATNGWGECRCGGDFGPDLKSAGYDAVVIEGRSEVPLYLFIDDDRVELRSAAHLRGKLVSDKVRLIRGDLNDPTVSVMCIGPGGENLSRIASVMCEHRAAGRGGAGAVMGSKNLLGIAVKGSRKVPIADSGRLRKAITHCLEILRNSETAAAYKKHGTTGDMPANDAAGDWPTKNWQANSWGKAEELYTRFFNHYLVKNHACYSGCPIACGRIVRVQEGKYQTPQHEGCEYESISAFTAFVMNEDIEAAIHATYLCNEYGIDTISAGALIAFAMECFEKGILDRNGTGGVDLSWGNSAVLGEMVRLIAMREGVGEYLADGVKMAAARLGGGSEEFAVHVKGLEGPAHDGRSGKALAVSYGTGNRGMCHIQPVEGMAFDSGKVTWGLMKYGVPDPNTVDRWDEQGKGALTKALQDALTVPDVLNTCKFFMYHGVYLEHLAEMFSASTGWEVSGQELIEAGERAINLQRMFNVREGMSRADDRLQERVTAQPRFGFYEKEPRCAIRDFSAMLDEYYEARGWGVADGVPTAQKLSALGLAW